jgi:DNA polymerase
MAPAGDGGKRILVVAEAPGKQEDEAGRQLVGRSGSLLRDTLAKLGIDMRKDCVLTSSLICRPEGNKEPTAEQISHCRPNVVATIDKHKPEIIIPIGSYATKSVIGHVWKESVGGITRWAGFNIPSVKLNAWICPTFHPALVLREKSKTVANYFHHHLKTAVAHTGRPYDTPPDYRSQVDRIRNPDKAAAIIRKMIKRGGAVAFDYETNMLKPEWAEHRILSCSVCWRGKKTIAYPWQGEAITATRELLRSPLPKIASNLKFEERWTKQEFGHGVRNWYFDTMLAAHVDDNRTAITSIKFQAFVLLGIEPYDDHISPLLKSKGDVFVNQAVDEIELDDLLLYNGLDSLLEYKVAELQMRKMQYPLPEGM